ncbi:L-threonylcarbamoyladenylate synthase [Lichenicola sp.]|uniref:L-threonylcarbamoyladenylate synthase n=1 Tax=Lichenicola sp. TaxID=2804529 RepID=UPI003AFFFFF2
MTERLRADPAGIARAARLLDAGRLVAFGTETVYGLGADAGNAMAVAAVFEAKRRPHFNPLIAHCLDADAAFREVCATDLARRLADAFWPGPLTLVLPRAPGSTVCALAAAGLATLAVRVPDGAGAGALLRAFGRPIAAPSANPSGGVSPSTADHVMDGLAGRIDAVLECGPCAVGLESTVLDLSGAMPVLLRPGGVPVEAIERLIGPVLRVAPSSTPMQDAPVAPGMLASHYAPSLPVRLDAPGPGRGEALLAFGPLPDALRETGLVWNLSPRGDLREAAARLFSGLRHLDDEGRAQGLTGIAAMPVPAEGLGLAIRDRLQRAAAPRPMAGRPAALLQRVVG